MMRLRISRLKRERISGQCGPFLHSEHAEVFRYSTVTDLARLRGLSTSVPLSSPVW